MLHLQRRAFLAALLILFLSSWGWAQSGDTRYVGVPLANVHLNPDASSEQVTQALLWEPVTVTSERGRWCKVFIADQYRTDKGYPGWMLKEQLQKADKPSSWWMVTTSKVGLRQKADAKSPLLSWAYLGTKIAASPLAPNGEWVAVSLPGRSEPLWATRKSLVALAAIERAKDGAPVVQTASLLTGTPYLWGGMSSQGIDCSGLTFTSYRLHGYSIPRDADQQFLFGIHVDPSDLVAGDLLFFGKDAEHITHVGMFIGDGKFIQASSSLGGVTVSVFGEPKFQSRFQGARRILK
jgi:cell wall-associated NlpC family hydrolase